MRAFHPAVPPLCGAGRTGHPGASNVACVMCCRLVYRLLNWKRLRAPG